VLGNFFPVAATDEPVDFSLFGIFTVLLLPLMSLRLQYANNDAMLQ